MMAHGLATIQKHWDLITFENAPNHLVVRFQAAHQHTSLLKASSLADEFQNLARGANHFKLRRCTRNNLKILRLDVEWFSGIPILFEVCQIRRGRKAPAFSSFESLSRKADA